VSGNPAGRPKKGLAVTEIAREFMATKAEGGITRLEFLLVTLYTMAIDRSAQAAVPAAKLLLSYLQAPPAPEPQPVEWTGADGVTFRPAIRVLDLGEDDPRQFADGEPLALGEPHE